MADDKATASSSDFHPTQVKGRSCAGCTMCCKLLKVEALDKPRQIWCKHCQIGSWCKIYDTRPLACRQFYCGYLINAPLGEHWKPTSSKMVLDYEADANRIVVHVDSSRPGAWREEPFYAEIKRWAATAAKNRGQVLVWQGREAIVVLPNSEKNLGPVRHDQYVVSIERDGPAGPEFEVMILDSDDPQMQALKKGDAKG